MRNSWFQPLQPPPLRPQHLKTLPRGTKIRSEIERTSQHEKKEYLPTAVGVQIQCLGFLAFSWDALALGIAITHRRRTSATRWAGGRPLCSPSIAAQAAERRDGNRFWNCKIRREETTLNRKALSKMKIHRIPIPNKTTMVYWKWFHTKESIKYLKLTFFQQQSTRDHLLIIKGEPPRKLHLYFSANGINTMTGTLRPF